MEEIAPNLLELEGVGTDNAGAMMVAAGENPDRLRSEASFAMMCGVYSTRWAAVSAIRRAPQLGLKAAAFATERHQLLMPAGIALDAQESVFEAPAFQERLELFFDELGE